MSWSTMRKLISLKLVLVIICSSLAESRIKANEAVDYPITRRDVADRIPKASASQQVSYVALQPYVAAGSGHGHNHGHHHHRNHGHHNGYSGHHSHPSHHGHGQVHGKGYGHNNGHGHGGYKKGYDSGFHKGHGYKGKKGFKDTTGYKKNNHGDFGKSNNHGYFDKGGKLYKGHKHKNKYYGDIHKGVAGKKGHQFGTKGHHNKGHKDKGFKNVYHKEEFHHNKKFYDDLDNKKYHNKYDDYDSHTKGHKGNDYEGGLFKGGFHNDKYGSKGEHQDAKYHDNDVKHKDSYGHKKYYGDDHKHGHKKGHKEGHSSDHGHDYHDDDHEHHHPHHNSHHDHPHHHEHHVQGHHDHDHDPGWHSHDHDIHAQEHGHHDYDHHHHGAHSQNKPIKSPLHEFKPEVNNKPHQPVKYFPKSTPMKIKESIHYGAPSKEHVTPHKSMPKIPPNNIVLNTKSRFPPSTKSSTAYYSKSHYKPTKFTETHSDKKFLKPEQFSTIQKFDSDASHSKPYSKTHPTKPNYLNSKTSVDKNGSKKLLNVVTYKPVYNVPTNGFNFKPITNSGSDNPTSYSNGLATYSDDPSSYSNYVYSENYPKKPFSKKPKFKVTKFSKAGKHSSNQNSPMSSNNKFKNSIFVALPNEGKSLSKMDNNVVVTSGYKINKMNSPKHVYEDGNDSRIRSTPESNKFYSKVLQTAAIPEALKPEKEDSFTEAYSEPLALSSSLSFRTAPRPLMQYQQNKSTSSHLRGLEHPSFDTFGDFAKMPELSR